MSESLYGIGPSTALAGMAVLALATAIIAARRYRDGFNPLTVFCITQIGLYTVFSGFVTYAFLGASDVSPRAIVETVAVATVYLFGVIAAYLPKHDPARRVYATAMRLTGIGYVEDVRRMPFAKILPLALVAVLAFAGVAALGGGGLVWLTDPRTGYQSYRSGVGSLYALVQWCLVVIQLYVLWALRPRVTGTVGITLVALFATYFLGSKNHLLVVIIISALYVNFFLRRIPAALVIGAAPVALAAHLALQLLQGTAADLVGTVAYFDYFTVTAQFLQRFGEFGYQLGAASLSSLWAFVPRALVPDKPYEYGILLIHRVLFPGAAEQGHTPGILGWALAYLDFGVVGVFASGVLTGLWQRASYEYFLRHRNNVVAFALMVQFAIWGLFAYAPDSLAILLCVGFALYLRLRVPEVRLGSPVPGSGPSRRSLAG